MSKKIGFIIDPIESINPKKETTLALAEAAFEMGFEVYFIEAHKISFISENEDKASVLTQAHKIIDFKVSCKLVLDKSDLKLFDAIDFAIAEDINCADLDIVMLRKDPPVDNNYIYLTYFLDHLVSCGVKVMNNPQSIRDVNEKCFILNFPDLISPSLITSDLDRIIEFLDTHQKIVLKPLNAMGGQGIIAISLDKDSKDICINKIKTMLEDYDNNIIMAQRFLDVHKAGDKRIILINGEPLPSALARFPKEGGFLANLAAGGHGKVVPLTARDIEISNRLSPILVERGLNFVGLDVVDGCLTEVNVTSPTCLREIAGEIDVGGMISKLFV
jgi:glutathione synthase